MNTTKQHDYQALALSETRRRAAQQNHRSDRRWAALGAQAVDLQQRIAAARETGDARQAEYARRALGGVVQAMGKLLTEQQMPDPTQPQPNGDPWTKR